MAKARTILLFRPKPQAAAFAAALDARFPGRFRAVPAPIFAIEPLPVAVDLDGVQGLAFTSAHAVAAFAALGLASALPAWCVGAATAAAARAAGLAAVSADGDAAALARLVAGAWRPGAGEVLYLRGRHAAGDLAARLREAGVAVRDVVVYDQPPRPLQQEARALLAAGGADLLAFFSPRGARLFAAEAKAAGWPLGAVAAVSISAATDAGLEGLGIGQRTVAARPDQAGMLAALARL
jgi:uroporphyrinogen-III synthase